MKPPKFWPGNRSTCIECYQTPAHLRRKRGDGRLTVRDVAELERHAKDIRRRRLKREETVMNGDDEEDDDPDPEDLDDMDDDDDDDIGYGLSAR